MGRDLPLIYVSTEGCGNVRTPQEAVAFCLSENVKASRNWYRSCDKFTANCYGFYASGYSTAKLHWQSIPLHMKGVDRTPPAGALVFFDISGDTEFDHMAVAVNDSGLIASVDVYNSGEVDLITISELEARWGCFYRGWAHPSFIIAGGKTPYPTYPTHGSFPLFDSHAFGYDPNNQYSTVHNGFNNKADAAYVSKIQGRIRATQSGLFGASDKLKVAGWQAFYLMPPTGKVDYNTWIKMFPEVEDLNG